MTLAIISRILKVTSMEAPAWVYVLKLDNGRYYIGSTAWLMARVEQHLAGRGAYATRLNKPTDIAAVYPCNSRIQAYSLEALLQYEQRHTHGWAPPIVSTTHELMQLHSLAHEHKQRMAARREMYYQRKARITVIQERKVRSARSLREIAASALERFVSSLFK